MKIIFLVIIFAIFVNSVHGQYFSVNPSSKTIDVYFDSPKGERSWSNPYTVNFEILVNNEMNNTLPVSVSPSSNDPSYVSVSPSSSFLTIPALSSESIKITVKIVDIAADGGTYSGRVRFKSDFQTEYISINVKTYWPSPTLMLMGNTDFGELKAGSSYSRSFMLKEIYKFRKANNVKIELNEAGPIYQTTSYPSTFSYIDSAGKSVTFSFRVKERGIVPGTYSPLISVSSTNDARLAGGLKYSIPRPVVGIKQLNSEIIFDHGKPETGNQRIEISEKGGKTPLENTMISFSRLSKELMGETKEYNYATWFDFPKQVDYIPPGGSQTIGIKVAKPEDASIGKYIWEGDVTTKYAGKEHVQFFFIVRPADISDLKKKLIDLKNRPLFRNYPEAEKLITATESLLSKDERRLADIANVISLTNVVIKFLNSTNAAFENIQQGTNSDAYENFRGSKEEIDELNRISLKQIYESDRIDIKTSANNVLEEVARLLMRGLEQSANLLKNLSYPDASYVEARRTYEKISEICSWLNDAGCLQEQNSRIIEMNTEIEELRSENAFFESEMNRMQEDINSNTWTISGIKLLRNPIRFLSFLDKYNEMVNIYNQILKNYGLIEEQRGFERTEESISILEREYENFRLVNSIYIIILGVILTVTVWKSIRAFINYRADAMDVRLAEVAQLKNTS